MDIHLSWFVNVGDFTFSNDEQLTVFWDPDEGSPSLHGERIYRHISGADVRVFVTDSEDDGSLPHDHTFWTNFFHCENISRHIYQGVIDYAAEVGLTCYEVHDAIQASSLRITTPTKVDHEAMRPYVGWMSTDRIRKTFERTTQFMRMPSSTYLRKRHRSANPAANIFQRGESDATDTIFLDTPAVDGGQTSAQLFAGRHLKLASVHPLKDSGEDEILGAFQDRVRWHGAPEELVGNNASVYTGSKFMKYVCDLYIRLWQSESYHQHQNYAENVWQSLKDGTNCLLDFSGAARNLWLLGLMYYVLIWNHTVDPNLADGTFSPYTLATGRSDDISAFTCFRFNEPVYVLQDQEQQHFPSQSKEIRGRWVGISEHVGAPMTWKILTDKTQKVIYCSKICSALDPKSRNLSIDPLSTTDFCMLPSPPPVDDSFSPSAAPSVPSVPSSDPAKVVFLHNHGECDDDSTSDQRGSSAPF